MTESQKTTNAAPKIEIDSDWKAEAQAEKEKLAQAEQKVEDNADAENPEKSELIEFDSSEVIENADELPGFGIMAAGASLLFVSRRFRK